MNQEQNKIEIFLKIVQDSLEDIGYRRDLIRRNYHFADIFSEDTIEYIMEIAAFGQDPTSHRSACFGLAVINSIDPKIIERYKSLGAPQIFSYLPSEDDVQIWANVSHGEPRLIESFKPEEFPRIIKQRQEQWNPVAMLRAKSIFFNTEPKQFDFFDAGLILNLESVLQTKLENLLRNTIASCRELYFELHNTSLDYASLYRLIFHLLAAKLLLDRQIWNLSNSEDVTVIIREVEKYYSIDRTNETIIDDVLVQELAWNKIRKSFNFQNLSLEAIAYVYESITDTDTRREYDIHATPSAIVEYIVQQLPFEKLDLDDAKIFELFSGHAPFLVASLGRLRNLLRISLNSKEKHEYFTRILSGIEIDPFAREMAFKSLRLADFPNPNGWEIHLGDAFNDKNLQGLLKGVNIILSNPPYSKVPSSQKDKYENDKITSKAVESLRIAIRHKPDMLGFVLPRSFLRGREYRALRKKIVDIYGNISLVSLPDSVFRFSEIETVLLIAHGKGDSEKKWTLSNVTKDGYAEFVRTGKPNESSIVPARFSLDKNDPIFIFNSLLDKLEIATVSARRLGEFVNTHRGVEYIDKVSRHVSKVPKDGFKIGVHKVSNSLGLYQIKSTVYLDTDPKAMRGNAYQYHWHESKIIVNAARRSRSPWTIEAAVDDTGLVCYQNFTGIWTKGEIPLEVIAAIINSPIANIYIYLTRFSSIHNQIQQIQQIPVPNLTKRNIKAISYLVQEYRKLKQKSLDYGDGLQNYNEELRKLLIRIDSEVWLAYKLPDDLAKSIQDFFKNKSRPHSTDFLEIDIRHSEQYEISNDFSSIVNQLLIERSDLWKSLSKY